MIVPWFAGLVWASVLIAAWSGLDWLSVWLPLVAIPVLVAMLMRSAFSVGGRLLVVVVLGLLVCIPAVLHSSSAAPGTGGIHRVTQDFEVRQLTVKVQSCLRTTCEVSSQLDGQRFEALLQIANIGAFVFDQQTPPDSASNVDASPAPVVGSSYVAKFRLKPTYSSDGVVLVPQEGLKQLTTPTAWHERLRAQFTSSMQAINPDAAALVAGIAIGDDSKLSPKSTERMKMLSLTHLTAVSGANCAIVLAFIVFALRPLGASRSLVSLVSLFGLWAYVMVVGFEASVLRAAIMAAVVITLSIQGRSVPPIVALGWAVLIVLSIWPDMADDLGFALSVAATAAILLLAPRIYERLSTRLPRFLALPLAVVLAAQLWCLPLLLQLSNGLPAYSVLANLLAEPLVAPITVLGICALAACSWAPGLAGALTWIASCVANLILHISSLADLAGASLWLPSGFLGVVIVTGIVIGVSSGLFRHSRLATLAVMSLVLLWLGTGSNTLAAFARWPAKDWFVVACDVGQGDALVLRSGGQTALIDVGREDKPIDDCLTRLGVQEIDLLVLTHFDADHVGGIGGALRNRVVRLTFITPFDDDRPMASFVKSALARRAIPAATVGCCSTGYLGDVPWVVLQPEQDAVGSEDSNDASIAMRFDFANSTVFTFADLGERAQMRLVRNHPGLLTMSPGRRVVIKVAHHGSGDQYPELLESLNADVALISVGKKNAYGHPTSRTLRIFDNGHTRVIRTDLLGSIALVERGVDIVPSFSGGG